MSEIQVFTSEEFGSVRSLEIDGEPWFVGKDVTKILGYTNANKAIKDHVDPEDKGTNVLDTPGGKASSRACARVVCSKVGKRDL